jgi:hypothetical protein
MFCRTYSSGVSLTTFPVRKSATLPSGTEPTATTVGIVFGVGAEGRWMAVSFGF